MSLNCAIYTRKSSEEGLEQSFNSLDAQREASEAFVLSQKAQGWKASKTAYEDGGYSGGTLERPALQRLLADVAVGRVQIVVVYKVDRLTRSLADFAKLVELFDRHGVSFVSVTQQFNTTSSMGRLTLNVLLSFAQFEREVTGERIRDKIAASKRKGLWMGGFAPVGYRPHERTLVIEEAQAERVRAMYRLYLDLGCVTRLQLEVQRLGWQTPERTSRGGGAAGDRPFSRGHLHRILANPVYTGKIAHKGQVFEGMHPAIVEEALWQAVQEQLEENRQGKRTRSRAKHASLLAGLVIDENGNRLTPTHANKGSRRYRYYVAEDADPPLRIPAQELEQAVVEALRAFLGDERRLLDVLDTTTPQALHAGRARAAAMAETLGSLKTFHALVERIEVGTKRLQVTIRAQALGCNESFELDLPVELKRCGMAMRLIVRSEAANGSPRVDAKLVAVIAKAQQWFGMLASGQAAGVGEIASAHQVGSSYVTRVIYLAFLAPDIIERIASGRAPVELSAERLTRMVPLPADWAAQRELLGMA